MPFTGHYRDGLFGMRIYWKTGGEIIVSLQLQKEMFLALAYKELCSNLRGKENLS